MIYFFAGLATGLFIAAIFKLIFTKASYDGVFKVDTSDPIKDRYTLELSTALEGIDKKKKLVLKIVPVVEKTRSNIEEE